MAFDRVDITDKRHAALQKGFNLRWPRDNVQGESSPQGADSIYICYDEQDILDAARHALAVPNGRITVRSGGHCYEGFVSNRMPQDTQEVLSILDIGPFTGMDYHANGGIASRLVPNAPYRYRFRVAAGNQNWDGYLGLYKKAGKTLPGGSCYSVGAGGHICGGGYGFLSRTHGLTCDWLSGVDMLVPNRPGTGLEAVHVSRDSRNADELDLFAACCGGGGGQFGIITSYYFKELPDAPKEVYWLVLEWDWATLTEPALNRLLSAYQAWFANNQADPATWGLATKLEMRHQNTGNMTLGIHYVDKDGLLLDLAPFKDFVASMLMAAPGPATESITPFYITHIPRANTPIGRAITTVESALDSARRMDWLAFTQSVNGSGDNQRGRYKSAYQTGHFTPRVLAAIWAALTQPDPQGRLTQSLIQIQSFGGRINAADADVLAQTSAAQRSSYLKWQPQCYWRDASEESDQAHANWIRALYYQAFADAQGVPLNEQFEGCYINYPDLDMTFQGGNPANPKNPGWRTIFYPDPAIENRLRRTKKTWDPLNIFRNEMSVPVV